MNKLTASVLLIAAILLAACGGGGDDPPATGSVYFRIDAATCPAQAARISFFIDGTNVGTETLAAGTLSRPYTTSGGSHVLSARLLDFPITWNPSTHSVPAGGAFTLVLTC